MKCHLCFNYIKDNFFNPLQQMAGCNHLLCCNCFATSLTGTVLKCPICNKKFNIFLKEEKTEDLICSKHGEDLRNFCKSCSYATCDTCWEDVHSIKNSCEKLGLVDGLKEQIIQELPFLENVIKIYKENVSASENELDSVKCLKLSLQNALWCIERDESFLMTRVSSLKPKLKEVESLNEKAHSNNSSLQEMFLLDKKLKSLHECEFIINQFGGKQINVPLKPEVAGLFKLYPTYASALKKLLERDCKVYMKVKDISQAYSQLILENNQIWLKKFEKNLPCNAICFEGTSLFEYQIAQNLDCILKLENDSKEIENIYVIQLLHSSNNSAKRSFLQMCLGLSHFDKLKIFSNLSSIQTLTNSQNKDIVHVCTSFCRHQTKDPTEGNFIGKTPASSTETFFSMSADIPSNLSMHKPSNKKEKNSLALSFPNTNEKLKNSQNGRKLLNGVEKMCTTPNISEEKIDKLSDQNATCTNISSSSNKKKDHSVMFNSEENCSDTSLALFGNTLKIICGKSACEESSFVSYNGINLPVIVDSEKAFYFLSKKPNMLGKDLEVIGSYYPKHQNKIASLDNVKWSFKMALSF